MVGGINGKKLDRWSVYYVFLLEFKRILYNPVSFIMS
jgi:hypothetical protein